MHIHSGVLAQSSLVWSEMVPRSEMDISAGVNVQIINHLHCYMCNP